jgi:flagellin
VANILKRMRELAVESSSETLADQERAYIQDEFVQLSQEVDRIASVTNFNGVQLADGSATGIQVQVGIYDTANDRITITMGDLRTTTLGVDTSTLDLSTATGAQAALTNIDTALDSVNATRAGFGASQNRLQSTMNNIEVYTESLAAAESRIRDADFAYESAEMTKFQIMQQAGVAVLGQANGLNQAALRLLG